jgi:hypothetical protein
MICIALMLQGHPLHVSVTEIEMDDIDGRLEIMIRVFMDDLETTFRNDFKMPELDILAPSSLSVDQMMEQYLSRHFKITLDNAVQRIQYLGHEEEGEAFIFYLEINNVKKWNTILIQNDIIMDTYRDQSNLVHVTSNSTVKSLRLTRHRPTDRLEFAKP